MLQNKYLENGFWDDLSPLAQTIFNNMYEYLIKRQEVTVHPEQLIMSDEQWKTIVYNICLVAAWSVDGEELPGVWLTQIEHDLPPN